MPKLKFSKRKARAPSHSKKSPDSSSSTCSENSSVDGGGSGSEWQTENEDSSSEDSATTVCTSNLSTSHASTSSSSSSSSNGESDEESDDSEIPYAFNIKKRIKRPAKNNKPVKVARRCSSRLAAIEDWKYTPMKPTSVFPVFGQQLNNVLQALDADSIVDADPVWNLKQTKSKIYLDIVWTKTLKTSADNGAQQKQEEQEVQEIEPHPIQRVDVTSSGLEQNSKKEPTRKRESEKLEKRQTRRPKRDQGRPRKTSSDGSPTPSVDSLAASVTSSANEANSSFERKRKKEQTRKRESERLEKRQTRRPKRGRSRPRKISSDGSPTPSVDSLAAGVTPSASQIAEKTPEKVVTSTGKWRIVASPIRGETSSGLEKKRKKEPTRKRESERLEKEQTRPKRGRGRPRETSPAPSADSLAASVTSSANEANSGLERKKEPTRKRESPRESDRLEKRQTRRPKRGRGRPRKTASGGLTPTSDSLAAGVTPSVSQVADCIEKALEKTATSTVPHTSQDPPQSEEINNEPSSAPQSEEINTDEPSSATQSKEINTEPSSTGLRVGPINRCFNLTCLKPDSHVVGGLQRCKRCDKAMYCSRECKAQHWRLHRKDCGKTNP